MNTPFYVQIIFAATAVNYFLIALLFLRSQSGRLRWHLILFFAVLGIVASLRCFERYAGPFLDPTTMAIIVGTPMLLVSSLLGRFVYRYGKGDL